MKCPYCDTEFEMETLAAYDKELSSDDKDDMKLYMAKKDEVITAIANGIISGFNLGAVSTGEKAEPIKELTTPNDIVWELSQRIEISDVTKAVKDLTKAMDENSSCYWMLKKIANKR